MLKNLSSKNVAWILEQIGITLKRRSKEDVFTGYYGGKNRVVIVPISVQIRQNRRHSLILS